MDIRERVKAELMAGWNGMVVGGLLTYDELTDSLLDQILGTEDMSADELTEDLAGMLGWDINSITPDQYEEWKKIVNEAAREYMEE
jgi:hypothetical protein